MRPGPGYLDGGIFIAFLDRSDRYHADAVRLFADPPRRWYTSLAVVSETSVRCSQPGRDRSAPSTHHVVDGFSAAALALMRRYRWPGNVRELENAVQRAVILAAGPEITDLDLPADVAGARPVSPTGEATLDELEREQILAALERSGGNRTVAAAALGIDRTTLHRKLNRYHGYHGQ